MKIIDILNKYAEGKTDELPKKIKIGDDVYTFNNDFYFNKKDTVELFDALLKDCDITEIIEFEIKEVKVPKKWIPEECEKYCYNLCGKILGTYYAKGNVNDEYRILTHNCFRTEEETKKHIENEKTYYELAELAEKLNDGNEIDWNDRRQEKYFIYYDYYLGELEENLEYVKRSLKNIYCLDDNFLEEAIKKLGEKKLINLFTNENN